MRPEVYSMSQFDTEFAEIPAMVRCANCGALTDGDCTDVETGAFVCGEC